MAPLSHNELNHNLAASAGLPVSANMQYIPTNMQS